MENIKERVFFQRKYSRRMLNGMNREVHFNAHLTRSQLVALQEFEAEEEKKEDFLESL